MKKWSEMNDEEKADLRKEIARRLDERIRKEDENKRLLYQPRYDDVYLEGLEWLDTL